MIKIVFSILFICAGMLPIQAKAEFKVPDSIESDQWQVELLVSSKDKDLVQEEKGKHEVYSALVTNKGGKVYNVTIGAFRNEPGTRKMYGLVPQMDTDLLDKGQAFRFTNFPVQAGTDQLKFMITWREESITLNDGKKTPGRKYMETFVFYPTD